MRQRDKTGKFKPSLTEEQVRQIKRDLDKREAIMDLMQDYTYAAIGKRAGIKKSPGGKVWAIDQGLSYKHIGED